MQSTRSVHLLSTDSVLAPWETQQGTKQSTFPVFTDACQVGGPGGKWSM